MFKEEVLGAGFASRSFSEGWVLVSGFWVLGAGCWDVGLKKEIN